MIIGNSQCLFVIPFQIQKFAVRFLSVNEAEKFMTLMKVIYYQQCRMSNHDLDFIPNVMEDFFLYYAMEILCLIALFFRRF